MKEFEANCSVIDVDFETIRHQGYIRAEGGNTEKQQVNTEKQEDSKEKKSGLNRFFEEIFYLIFLLLIAVPFLIIAVGYFLGKAIIYIIIFTCFIFHAAFVAFQLFLDYIDAKKANAKS